MPSLGIRAVRLACAVALVVALGFAAGLAVGEATADAAQRHKRHKRHIVVRGVTIRAVQRAVGVAADGIWGPRTERAVRRFQRRHGLVVDGVVGPNTARAMGLAGGALRRKLARIARCESGGNPRAVSARGRYRGKYQFSRATWRAVGGSGDPARASEREQDRRAAILYRRTGGSAWPNCA